VLKIEQAVIDRRGRKQEEGFAFYNIEKFPV